MTETQPKGTDCPLCKGQRWTCVTHKKPMGHGSCRDEGEPCLICNPLASDPNQMPGPDLKNSLPDGFQSEIRQMPKKGKRK